MKEFSFVPSEYMKRKYHVDFWLAVLMTVIIAGIGVYLIARHSDYKYQLNQKVEPNLQTMDLPQN